MITVIGFAILITLLFTAVATIIAQRKRILELQLDPPKTVFMWVDDKPVMVVFDALNTQFFVPDGTQLTSVTLWNCAQSQEVYDFLVKGGK